MNSLCRHLHLRHAAGYIELGELLADGDAPVPENGRKLLQRALAELRHLPEPNRSGPVASLLEVLPTGLETAPSQPLLLYNLACYHSLAGDVSAAVGHLTQAISLDDRFRDLTGAERDFDPIRGDPRFLAATLVVV